MMQIKNEEFFKIQGWMVQKLNLKGISLLIFAIIYTFTQGGKEWFKGSRAYLASWCNATLKGIQKNLNGLVEKEILIKKENWANNVKFCEYKINSKIIPFNPTKGGGEQSSSCNIDDTLHINNIKKKRRNDHLSSFKKSKKLTSRSERVVHSCQRNRPPPLLNLRPLTGEGLRIPRANKEITNKEYINDRAQTSDKKLKFIHKKFKGE